MKILLVTPWTPYAPRDSGGHQRTFLVRNALADLGSVDVARISQYRETSPPTEGARDLAANLDAPCRRPPFLGWYPSSQLSLQLARCLKLGQYDLIVGRYVRPWASLSLPSAIPSLVDVDDLGFQYATSDAVLTRWRSRVKSAARFALDRAALRRASAVCFVSERDRLSHPALVGEVVPNIPIAPRTRPSPSSRSKAILFVGGLGYAPNRTGLERFLARAWPQVLASVPEATLLIVGKASVEDRRRLGRHPSVEVGGFVEDLEPVYDRCAFAIAPVYSGGGTNIKVVEALAHRRTCVITSYSLAAFTPMLKDGTDIVSAKDDEGMAVTCVRFLRDQEFRNRVAEQGYMTVLSRFSPSVFSAAVARAAALAISQHARAINAWGRPCRLRAHR